MNISNNNKKRYYKSNSRPTNRKGRGGRKASTLNPDLLVNEAEETKVKEFKASFNFNEMGLEKSLAENIQLKGYKFPTQIQEESIEQIISGRNLVGVANTGTGKTGAFIIPIVQQLLTQNRDFTTLVIVPTRELAQQVEAEFKWITRGMGYYVSCFIGGTPLGKDLKRCNMKNHMIVGTPGRLMDLADRGALKLQGISTLVLDEFDRMLDMGFVNDIKKIVGKMHQRKQTLLFSATIESSQKNLIANLVSNPVHVRVNSGTKAHNAIDQKVIRVTPGDDKFLMLMDIVNGPDVEKTIVFAETKRQVDKLSKKLMQAGINTGLIHGNKSQNYRTKTLNSFKKGNMQILVATDVAARGIDVNNVSHVINYELPMTMDSYVHRIGRTGRAGNKGIAYTFV